ncbi:hypothetical protein [Aeromicrobium endophyticum]|uniref:Uncharacterized protein n=1 Tax=Aeromicrobium endophyticum TaxID=2292704 RepID=A0A371PDC2_9ACTN|nr:hypothetical protein [Aeromicrobium endophyticum]REK73636.1 hypothetical protein DX116_08910 [Aeromicrobium endophyticum]
MKPPARWRPARLLIADVVVLTIGLTSVAAIRGFDYSTGDDSRARGPKPGVESALVGIEAAFPLWTWGLMLGAGVAFLIVGMTCRWHSFVWTGHVILCFAYAGLCAGLVAGYLDRPWFDGIRSGAGLALPALLHYLLWWRMGFRPVETEGAAGVPRSL